MLMMKWLSVLPSCNLSSNIELNFPLRPNVLIAAGASNFGHLNMRTHTIFGNPSGKTAPGFLSSRSCLLLAINMSICFIT